MKNRAQQGPQEAPSADSDFEFSEHLRRFGPARLDYNGESFFVRRAYLTDADEPHDKLKRALRAEIDEAAWASLYSTTSRPFDLPAAGKVAVKVINHYADEVLKVYEI